MNLYVVDLCVDYEDGYFVSCFQVWFVFVMIFVLMLFDYIDW